jgi:acetyltransferase-like isoleucine patch superfamily enzyme
MVFANAVVLPNIRIGEGAVAAAGAVVTRDLEPWTIYAGVPARQIGLRAQEGVLSAERALIACHPSPLLRYRDETALAGRG